MFFSNNYRKYSDEKLMAYIISKNDKAFEELYERYSKKMVYYFYQKLNFNEFKANDFVQDLFLKLIENPSAFNLNKTFSIWIYSLANNMCKNEYKRLEIRDVKLYKKEQEEPLQIEEINRFEDFNTALHIALSKLKEKQRTTFILKHKENFTINEISLIMSCSEGTVKSRLYNTVRKLAKELSSYNKEL